MRAYVGSWAMVVYPNELYKNTRISLHSSILLNVNICVHTYTFLCDQFHGREQ